MKTYAIILASGSGERFNNEFPKQFVKISDKTILEYSVEAFSEFTEGIVVVINPDYRKLSEDILSKYEKVISVVDGGKTRKESSYNGVMAIKEEECNVLIHDCARPCISKNIIKSCIKALEKYNAIGVAIPSSDTILKVKGGKIESVLERSELARMQTPQGFKLSLIKHAHEITKQDTSYTDDCSMIIKNNLSDVYIVEGSMDNIKITYPNDIFQAKEILSKL